PSRLVGESSGGEVRKQQLDTRVRQEPPGGPHKVEEDQGRQKDTSRIFSPDRKEAPLAPTWHFSLEHFWPQNPRGQWWSPCNVEPNVPTGSVPPCRCVVLSEVLAPIWDLKPNKVLGQQQDLDLIHLLSSQYVERHFSREGPTQHSTVSAFGRGWGGGMKVAGSMSTHTLCSPRGLETTATTRGGSEGTRTPLLPSPPARGCSEYGEGLGGRDEPLALGTVTSHQAPVSFAPISKGAPRDPFPTSFIGPLSSQPPSDAGNQVRRGHPTVHSETKYVELIVINDHQLFEQMRQSVVLTSNFAKSVMYKEQLNTRIVLVAMETWADGDKIQVQDDLLETLARLMYDNMGAMAVTLAQTLGQNLGMMFYLPRKFSRCSIDEYNQFLQEGGGSCLFNKPLKLLDPPECGNGFVEAGEECDCGSVQLPVLGQLYSVQPLSPQCPPNLHKLDGYYCDHEQGRCYGGRCKTRDRQCQALWGHAAADRFCYEKLNVEGTERGNCGRKGSGWVQCNKQDVLCGFLLCVNISGAPRLGDLGGDISSVTFYHQGKELDCRGGHVQLADGSDLSYVEDGTACGPNMLNEGKCICQPDWTGKDCSIHNPLPTSLPTGETERYKGEAGAGRGGAPSFVSSMTVPAN
ncbi:hypothetical protein E2I00_017314, partial [Balaenoptera physalus]